MKIRMCLLFALCISVAATASAGVYKWTDAEGRVHYGDSPQAAQSATEVKVDETIDGVSVGSDVESRDEKRQRLLDAMEEDRLEKKTQREAAQAEQTQRNQRCVRLKDRLKNQASATGVYRLDNQGNRVFIDDAQRKSAEAKLRAQINEACR
jgi:hypothetical protein